MPKPNKQTIVDDVLNQAGNSKAIPMQGYYVYAILENNSICYIGKGKKYRVTAHFKGYGNMLLYSKIKDGVNIYDWVVLKSFENESDALDFETAMIKDCIKNNIHLYNSAHYSTGTKSGEIFRGAFSLLKDYENRIFPDAICSSLSVSQLAELVIKLFKDICKSLPKDKIPTYRSKPLNELNYLIRPEYGKNRIVIY